MGRSNLQNNIRLSLRVLQFCMLAVLLIFWGRLIQLQIVEYETYSPLSRANTLQQERIIGSRGLIYDRNGQLLVENEPIYTLTVTPANFDRSTIPLLADLLDSTEREVRNRLEEAQEFSWHRASRLYTEIDFQTFSRVQENIWRLPGISHQIESKRSYTSGARASHILGYLREVNDQEYRSSDFYQLGDRIGRMGLESVYEDEMRGEPGQRYHRVNAYGQTVGSYEDGEFDITPTKGADLHTGIDLELQALGERLMEGKTGGVVAMDPRDGSILSLVSSPQYEVERLAGQLDREYWESMQADTTQPLFNRAISTMQPPGSTIKPMMGLIGLDLDVIDPDHQVVCRGGYMRGRFYRCIDEHGPQNLEQAILNSCNTFFFSLIDDMMDQQGLNVWHQRITDFGFGRINHIDLPYENSGIVPDSTYYDNILGENQWGVGELISLGVGQGAFSSSPLQLALSTTMIANGGYQVQPHIVRRKVMPDGDVQTFQQDPQRIEWLEQEHLDLVRNGMRRAITEGSGRFYADLPNVEVAGKTGTSQNPHGNDHGWFIAYAPYDDPEIAIAVLMENAGFGSISAAPVASLMMEQYFNGEINRQWIKDYVLEFEPEEVDDDQEQPL